MSKSIKIHGALLVVTLLYSANYSIAKFALPEYLEPFGFIIVRIFCAGALFWVFSLKDQKESIKDKKDYWLILICAFFGVAQNQLLFFKGLSLTTPINASV
ncbi:MAG: EamA family transporter, partial [Bacteroidota bacterium]